MGVRRGSRQPRRRTHELRSEPELRHPVAASVMLGRRLAKKRAGRACLPRRLRAGSSSAPYGAELHPPRPGVYRGALVHPHSEQSSERQGSRRGRAENRAAARILSASPTTRIPRNARSEYLPWRWPPAWTIVEARPMPRSRDSGASAQVSGAPRIYPGRDGIVGGRRYVAATAPPHRLLPRGRLSIVQW